MKLKELEEMREFNELDVLYVMIEKIQNTKKRAEQLVKGNKTAGVDVRRGMQDIKLLSDIIRDKVQNRKCKNVDYEDTKIFKAIKCEKDKILHEEERIRKIEEKIAEKRASLK